MDGDHAMRRISFFVFACLWSASLFASEFDAQKDLNWHQWRGPYANGVSPNANPPIQWSESKNIKWKAELPGEGCSTPIIWGDQVFVLTAIQTDKTDPKPVTPEPPADPATSPQRIGMMQQPGPSNYYQFVVLCYDRQSGKLRWQKIATEQIPHQGHHQTSTFASSSPVTDGKNLYVSFGSRGIYCYDLNGELKWSHDLGDMQIVMGFGEGSSPSLYQDSLIVNWDNEGQSFITNLDAKTGEPKWKVDRDEKTSWATPLVVDFNGKPQVVTNASKRTRSYDLETGKLLWECGGQVGNVIPSPVAYQSSVICMSGYRGNASYALSLDSSGDITGTDKVLWSYNRDTPYAPSPLLYGSSLYFTKSNSPILTCLNVETGHTIIEQTRLPDYDGTIYASPVGAANRIYFLTREGKSLVIKNEPKIEVLANNKLDDEFNASPAVVGNQLFLRGKKYLYCIEEEKQS